MEPRKPPLERRPRFDPWAWYGVHLPGWAAFTLPILLLPVPALFHFILDARGEVFRNTFTVTSTLAMNLDAGIITGLGLRFEWWFIWILACWAQLVFLSWILRNMELLRRWGWFDRFLTRREERARQIYAQKHWIRKFHFWGVFVFTFLPLGSGVVMGVLVGKATGMPTRMTWLAVYTGTLTWALLLVYALGLGIKWLEPWLGPHL